MIWGKVKSKFYRSYFNWKLRPVKRRAFHPLSYLQELSCEPVRGCLPKPILLLHYDDICLMDGPEFYDYGAKPGGIWDLFISFSKAYPKLKHTLFFIPNPIFTETGLTSNTISDEPFNVAKANPDHWLLKALQHESMEVALHGYHHVQTVYPDFYAPFEFDFLSVESCEERIKQGLEGLSRFFKMDGFKPPAWSMGQLLGRQQLVEALKKYSFEYVCLSSPSNGLNYASRQVSHVYPCIYDGLFNVPQNISILWELEIIKKVIDVLLEKRGIINIQLHFTETRDALLDGICKRNLEKLAKVIDYLSQYDVQYALTRDVRGWTNAVQQPVYIFQ